ncbi:MAG: GNAT family N-acetyltransferase [Pseudomonadota bacterium]
MSAALLRRALPVDSVAVAEIHIAARRRAMPYLPELHSDAEIHAWVRGTLITRAEVWLAETGEHPSGYMALVGQTLDHLYVAPEQQGRGIGSMLLKKAKMLRPDGLQLYAFQRNHRARAFYEARGFKAVAFSDGADNEEKEPDVLYQWPARAS